LFTWIYGVVIDRLYDVFIGVYILVWIGGHRFTVSVANTAKVQTNLHLNLYDLF